MELSVKDRLYLPTFLPARGNFKEFNLKKEILRKIAIGDEERKTINLRENAEDKRIEWDVEKIKTMEMDIKELTEKYRERFEAFYHTEGSNTDRKGNRRKRTEESPSFLKEVIRPILDMLPELLPKYGFTKTTDEYAMYGKYYRIKAGVVLIGGFSINEDFGLFFTPLFHGKACGKSHRIDNMKQLVKTISEEFEKREVKMRE